MSPKRPAPPKPSPTSDELTDEWGIYDPEKAGIPALLKRLGRPVLRAAPTSTRRDRRRGLRPERSAEGVGLALNEVRRRAGLLPDEDPSLAAGNPARAMRFALKARAAADHVAVEPYVPPPAEAEAPPVPEVVETPPAAALVADVPPAPPARKRARKAVAAEPAAPVVEATPAPAPTVEPSAVAARPRGRKVAARGRARTVVTAPVPAPVPAPAAAEARTPPVPVLETSSVAAPPAKVAPAVKAGPPAPSPRRPRGPVPLAAWAHAVAETPRQPARRVDPRGFWRGIFRIPAEVALVEYAHGCRIHRLLVEAGDDHAPDFI